MSAATLRRWYSYIGLFIAPSVLFFALTGAMQLFSLHEEHGTYKPWAIVEKLSSVHKDQTFALSNHHPPPAPENTVSMPSDMTDTRSTQKSEDDGPRIPALMLKVVFLVTAMGLTLSAVLGLWIGLTQTRMKRTAWILVIAGTVTPVALLMV